MTSFLVYLAGPITGLTYDGAVDWRDEVRRQLYDVSCGAIQCLSPMRHKDYLRSAGLQDTSQGGGNEGTRIADSYEDTVLSSQRGIYYRDKFDCIRADAVLFNLLGAPRVSMGTIMEIGWASFDGHKPLVAAMEPTGNVHEHAMVREALPFRVPTLHEAVDTVYKILCP